MTFFKSFLNLILLVCIYFFEDSWDYRSRPYFHPRGSYLTKKKSVPLKHSHLGTYTSF